MGLAERWGLPRDGACREMGTRDMSKTSKTAARVLVVEDDEAIRIGLSKNLEFEGYDVALAADGESGLRMAVDDQPDLLILDVGLPKMDGWQVLDRIRSDMRTRNLKVLVLTAHAQEETRERADRGGADAFVTKPFRPDELRTVAESLIGAPASAARLG